MCSSKGQASQAAQNKGRQVAAAFTCLPRGMTRSGMVLAEAAGELLGLSAAGVFPYGIISFGTCRDTHFLSCNCQACLPGKCMRHVLQTLSGQDFMSSVKVAQCLDAMPVMH